MRMTASGSVKGLIRRKAVGSVSGTLKNGFQRTVNWAGRGVKKIDGFFAQNFPGLGNNFALEGAPNRLFARETNTERGEKGLLFFIASKGKTAGEKKVPHYASAGKIYEQFLSYKDDLSRVWYFKDYLPMPDKIKLFTKWSPKECFQMFFVSDDLCRQKAFGAFDIAQRAEFMNLLKSNIGLLLVALYRTKSLHFLEDIELEKDDANTIITGLNETELPADKIKQIISKLPESWGMVRDLAKS